MANLFPKLLAAVAAIASLTAASSEPRISHGVLRGGPGKAPINWEARFFSLDYKTQHVHLRGDVKISQGEISVVADEAESTSTSEDSKSSHWIFTGKVHVRAESQGDLHSDHATLEIANGELASALVTGSPAQFEQTRSTTGRLVKGHANAINYDVASAVVKLTDDAWLTDDHNENDMKACEITYNVRDRQIQGQSEHCPGGHVHMTLTPHSVPGGAAAGGSAPMADPGLARP
jgi:lipopolysaccharide transport protein LptA